MKETKSLTLDIALNEEGKFSGYASVFNVPDRQNDIVLPGAFKRTLIERGGEVKLLWQHSFEEPIGVIENLYEDNTGLFMEARLLLDVSRGKEAYSLLKAGAVEGLSIGYTVTQYDYAPKTGHRLIKDVDLWEVSLVTFPANAQAKVAKVKKLDVLPKTIREFERFLHESGFSRDRARELSSKGFVTSKPEHEISAEELREWKVAAQSGELIKLSDALGRALKAISISTRG
jgi:HK97 family phage prohead protease